MVLGYVSEEYKKDVIDNPGGYQNGPIITIDLSNMYVNFYNHIVGNMIKYDYVSVIDKIIVDTYTYLIEIYLDNFKELGNEDIINYLEEFLGTRAHTYNMLEHENVDHNVERCIEVLLNIYYKDILEDIAKYIEIETNKAIKYGSNYTISKYFPLGFKGSSLKGNVPIIPNTDYLLVILLYLDIEELPGVD